MTNTGTQPRRPRPIWFLVASGWLGLLGLLLSPSPLAFAAGNAEETTPTAAKDVCPQAQALNDAALPQKALALIDDLRGTPGTTAVQGLKPPDSDEAECHSERNIALQRIARAQLLTSQFSQAKALDEANKKLADAKDKAANADDETASPDPTLVGPSEVEAAQEEVNKAESALKPQTCEPTPAGANVQLGGKDVEKAYLEAARACDAENELVVAALATPESQNAAQKGADFWDKTLKTVIEPQVSRATAALVILLLLLILARLLTRWVNFNDQPWKTQQSGPLSSTDRRVLGAGGAVLLAVAVWAGTAGWGLVSASAYWPWLVFAIVTGAIGALFLAWVWSEGRSIAITVVDGEGKEDHAAAAHIAALLFDLGATPPKGIEVAVGTDTTALATAGLTTTPEGTLAALAYKAVQLLIPLNPWRITVDVSSTDLNTITVTRNGRLIARELIDRDQLRLRIDLPKPDGTKRQPDLLRMTAAAALAALNQGMNLDGLAGATKWRSIGWHYVATTDLAGAESSTEQIPNPGPGWHYLTPAGQNGTAPGVALLARAVADDPKNLLAQQALWSFCYRQSTDPAELRTYLALLEGLIIGAAVEVPEPAATEEGAKAGPPKEGMELLVLRAMISRLAVAINLSYLADDGTPVQDSTTADTNRATNKAPERYVELSDERARIADPNSNLPQAAREYAKAIESNVKILGWSAERRGEPKIPDDASTVLAECKTPIEAYQAACYFASAERLAPNWYAGEGPIAREPAADSALTHLRYADSDPTLREWRTADPQLAWLRERDEYKKIFPSPVA